MNNMNTGDIKTITSYDVAKMIGRKHWEVLRMIEGSKDRKGIIEILNKHQVDVSEYFIKSEYKNSKGEMRKCYECTKMGCDMLANKRTGVKGTIFAAKYVKRFKEMEEQIKEENQFKLPGTYKEALLELVHQIEEKEKIEEEKNRLIHQGC